jgi:hypothetical protein
MKKINFLLAGLFLSLLFVGCEKDLDPVNPEVINTPVITVNHTLNNNQVTLNWDIKFAESVSLGTTPVAAKGDTVIKIKNDTTFVFSAENKGKKAKESFFVEANNVVLPLPNMILSVSPDTLPIGGGIATISGTATHATIVYWNNIGYDTVFSITTPRITKDTIVSFMAVGPGGSKTFGCSVKVKLPPDPIVLSFGKMSATWKFSGLNKSYDLATWENITLPSFQADDIWIFNQNHKAMIDYGTNRVENQIQFRYFENWNLEADSSISGFILDERKLISVDETTLEVVFKSIEVTIKPNGSHVDTLIYWKEIFTKQ